ncbi:GntR family transcriptional regulator, partial [Brucella endophytica]
MLNITAAYVKKPDQFIRGAGMSEGRVEALYAQLKEMTVNFRLRPGERLNEVMLARELDASRTPLREALNRLVAEQLIDFQPGKGFFWCARRSWRVPAGESPARVRGS